VHVVGKALQFCSRFMAGEYRYRGARPSDNAGMFLK
jgi:hypothetical protein